MHREGIQDPNLSLVTDQKNRIQQQPEPDRNQENSIESPES